MGDFASQELQCKACRYMICYMSSSTRPFMNVPRRLRLVEVSVVSLRSMINMNSPNLLLLSWSKRMNMIFGIGNPHSTTIQRLPQLVTSVRQNKFVFAKGKRRYTRLTIISIRDSICMDNISNISVKGTNPLSNTTKYMVYVCVIQ
jgi:hypothetical protein